MPNDVVGEVEYLPRLLWRVNDTPIQALKAIRLAIVYEKKSPLCNRQR